MKDLFYQFPKNLFKSILGKNTIWHMTAIILTYIIVMSGFDWIYFLSARNTLLNKFLFPSIIGGAIFPIIFPLFLMIYGKVKNKSKLYFTGVAVGQAGIIAWLISSTYKAFTGRIQPDLTNLVNDISHGFQLGFWNHGIFWGWPSSHTTVSFAMAVTLIFLYPRRKIIEYPAVLYALYVGLGVSISVHWFSEFIAGAIIGSVIGMVVGKSFKSKVK